MRTRKGDFKFRNFYLLLIMFFAVCICNSQVYSMDVMGPAPAEQEAGGFNFGIEYSYTEMDLDLKDGYYTDLLDGVLYDWGDAQDITMKDLQINRTYARFGYGITDDAEVYIRLGGMSARFEDTIWQDSEEFSSDVEFAAGAGVKLTFYNQDNVKLGGLFQFSISNFDGQLESPNWLTSDFVEIDMTEAQIALGASCKCNENLTIYGGPFLHFVSGDISDNMSELSTSPAGLLTSKFDWDIEQRSVFGGCFGAQINFSEQSSLNLEFQQTSDASTFGMGLLFRF